MTTRTYLGTTTLIVGLMAASASFAQGYDLVIKGGRVIDPETMFDDVADVGISDGRIVAISKAPLEGEETIDATGLVVAPGFIDTHYHATDLFGAKLGVADGITTAMDLEHGATRIGEWYDNMAKRGAHKSRVSNMKRIFISIQPNRGLET